MLPFLKGALTGLMFGVVLYKVGATRYSRVMGMLTLRDTKIMKFALSAMATASLLYGLAAVFGVAESWNLVPRVMPYFGWGHVVGGVLFGASLGFSGLCPGTCIAKTGGRGGEKKFVGLTSIFGLVAGVFAYSALKAPLTTSGIIAENQKPITLHGALGLPYGPTALVFGALILAGVLAINASTPEKRYAPARERKSLLDYVRGEWSWLAAGIVGGTVVVASTMQDGYLGFSGAVLAAVGSVMHLVGAPLEAVPKITDDILWRAALVVGVLPGGLLAHALSLPSQGEAQAKAEHSVKKVLDLKALPQTFLAGLGISLGALIGGGCTTGAFISAWPTLSVGSFAMAGTFFAAAMAVGNLRRGLHAFDLEQTQLLGDRVYD